VWKTEQDERARLHRRDDHLRPRKIISGFGDAIGKKMFRHSANEEAELAWHNAVHGKKSRINYLTVPHAVFSYPEIASVGLTEEQAFRLIGKKELLVGKARYADVARGEAMMEQEGFAKAVVARKSGKVLGYHIIGPQASILLQEVVNVMAADGNLWSIAKGMHIHPALSEVVLKAFETGGVNNGKSRPRKCLEQAPSSRRAYPIPFTRITRGPNSGDFRIAAVVELDFKVLRFNRLGQMILSETDVRTLALVVALFR
jgi:hypothetical protein